MMTQVKVKISRVSGGGNLYVSTAKIVKVIKLSGNRVEVSDAKYLVFKRGCLESEPVQLEKGDYELEIRFSARDNGNDYQVYINADPPAYLYMALNN
ncbi:MAG: hypothetical protein L0Y73_01995, partial [Candidatus Aminicenantes bacterium]|nr:hypothetical protein [Candidatus Aminicenantes bacterium]